MGRARAGPAAQAAAGPIRWAHHDRPRARAAAAVAGRAGPGPGAGRGAPPSRGRAGAAPCRAGSSGAALHGGRAGPLRRGGGERGSAGPGTGPSPASRRGRRGSQEAAAPKGGLGERRGPRRAPPPGAPAPSWARSLPGSSLQAWIAAWGQGGSPQHSGLPASAFPSQSTPPCASPSLPESCFLETTFGWRSVHEPQNFFVFNVSISCGHTLLPAPGGSGGRGREGSKACSPG